MSALTNTIVVGALSGLVAIGFSLPIGWTAARVRSNASLLILIVTLSLAFVPLYVQAGAWSAGFGMLGWWTLSQADAARAPLQGIRAVVWIHAIGLLPLSTILLMAFLGPRARQQELTAAQDGGWLHWLRYGIGVRIASWAGLVILLSFATISAEMLITNLYQVFTLTERYYLDSTIGELTFINAIQATLPSLCIAIVGAVCISRISSQRTDSFFEYSIEVESGRANFWPQFMSGCILGSVLLVPLFNLSIKAGASPQLVHDQIERGWSASQLIQTLVQAPQEYATEFYWSGIIGIGAGSLSLFCGLVLALLQKRFRWFRMVFLFAAVLCFSLPGPAIYRVLISTSQALGSDLSYWVQSRTLILPILAIQFRVLPLALVLLTALVHRHSTQTAGPASADQLSIRERVWIFLSACKREIGLLWVVCFGLSIADLSTIIMLLPPGISTLSTRIFELLHYGVRYKEAGLCLFLMLGFMLVGAIVAWISRTTLRKSTRQAD